MWRKEEVIEKLKEKQGDRSLAEYAESIGCTASLLSQVYNGKRELSTTLLDHLGMQRTVTYESKPTTRRWR